MKTRVSLSICENLCDINSCQTKSFKLLVRIQKLISNKYCHYKKPVSGSYMMEKLTFNQWTHAIPLASFNTPLKTSENQRFSDVFRRGIERDQWYKIGRRPMFLSYKNQPIDLHNESTDKFLMMWTLFVNGLNHFNPVLNFI